MASRRKRRRRVTFEESFAKGGEGVPDTTRNDTNYFISRVVAAAWYSVLGEPVRSTELDLGPDDESTADRPQIVDAQPEERPR